MGSSQSYVDFDDIVTHLQRKESPRLNTSQLRAKLFEAINADLRYPAERRVLKDARQPPSGKNLLHFIVEYGAEDPFVAESLLSEAKKLEVELYHADKRGRTPLHLVALFSPEQEPAAMQLARHLLYAYGCPRDLRSLLDSERRRPIDLCGALPSLAALLSPEAPPQQLGISSPLPPSSSSNATMHALPTSTPSTSTSTSTSTFSSSSSSSSISSSSTPTAPASISSASLSEAEVSRIMPVTRHAKTDPGGFQHPARAFSAGEDFSFSSAPGGHGVSSQVLRGSFKGAPVALKIVVQDEWVSSLKRELELLASLDHANVIDVITVTRVELGGALFLALMLPWADRGDLADWLARHPGEPPRVKEGLLRQAARGLAYLHGRGVVHNDFKPKNLLLFSLPEGGLRLRLIDLGLAFIDQAHFDDTPCVQAATPVYAAPERFPAPQRGARPAPQSDYFSFGATAWHVVSNACPYQDPDDPRRYIREQDTPLPFLSHAAHPGYSPEMIDFVNNCIQLPPSFRPTSFDPILSELE